MSEPYYQQDGVTIYHGDCREVLPALDRDFDLLLTDPPYGIGAPNMTLGIGKRNFVRGDWDSKRPNLEPFLLRSEWAVVWGGNYFTDTLPPTNDWLCWHKKNDGRSFSEFELAWTNLECNCRHLSHHWGGEEKRHPTQKPLDVMLWAMQQAPDECETVLDPFMGSGTTLLAAKRLGKEAVGIDREEKYCEIAIERLRQRELFNKVA